jgi:hypothetical protein
MEMMGPSMLGMKSGVGEGASTMRIWYVPDNCWSDVWVPGERGMSMIS